MPRHHETGPPRRRLPDFSAQPVLVLPAPDPPAAAVFPAAAVRNEDVRGRWVRKLVHTALAVALAVAFAVPWDRVFVDHAELLTGAPAFLTGWVALAFACFFLVGIDYDSTVFWPAYVVAGTVGVVVCLEYDRVMGATAVGSVAVGAACLIAALRRVKVRRWRSLRHILDDHVLVRATVTSASWTTTSGAGPVHLLRLGLESDQSPPTSWLVEFSPDTKQLDHAPDVGDTVPVFVCRSRPEVAVVRPIIPGTRTRTRGHAKNG